MSVLLLACKETVTRMKKLLIWITPLCFEFCQLLLPIVVFQQKFNGEYIISYYFFFMLITVVLIYSSLYRGMHIKATTVANVVLAQYLKTPL